MMKRFVSILFIFIFVFSAFSAMSISAFAEDDFAGSVQDGAAENIGKLTELLKSLEEYVPTEELEKIKSELTTTVKAVWLFIQSDETYKNIFTAIVGVLAFLFLPILIGLVIVVYAIMAGMIMMGGALVEVVKVFLEILIPMLPVLFKDLRPSLRLGLFLFDKTKDQPRGSVFCWKTMKKRIYEKISSAKLNVLEKALAKASAFSGGGWWIRTTEVSDNRFTVCPLWPLGKSPKWSW